MSATKEELAYVLINPYTVHKSRTGGVIARLFTRTALELVAARMFAPSRELVERYAEVTVSTKDPQDRKVQELIRQYILDNYSPDPKTGRRHRVMMLLFRGEDAVRKVRQVVGSFQSGKGTAGETIRDTYGDYIVGPDGQVKYFEPAVLAARWWHVVVAFALFRLFDVWKPPPVREAEDFSGGIGIVLDDLLAAAYACVATHLVVYLVSLMRH